MKVGDCVRVVGVPQGLPDDDMGTERIFSLCLGRVFPVVGFQNGLVELNVGEVVGEKSFQQTIWIEPEFVEVTDTSA